MPTVKLTRCEPAGTGPAGTGPAGTGPAGTGNVARLLISQSNSLPELADQIREDHAAIEKTKNDGLALAIAAGKKLIEARVQVKKARGASWMEWVQENCGFSQRTAQVYMQAAKCADPSAHLSIKGILKHHSKGKPRAQMRRKTDQTPQHSPKDSVTSRKMTKLRRPKSENSGSTPIEPGPASIDVAVAIKDRTLITALAKWADGKPAKRRALVALELIVPLVGGARGGLDLLIRTYESDVEDVIGHIEFRK